MVDQLAETAVRIEYDAVFIERDGTLFHLLDENAVGAVGVLQGVDKLACGTAHDDGVDFAVTDRVERFVGLLEKAFELRDPGALVRGRHG
ncbi:hypothetical protein KRR38_11335 [Novosphingobium sp. G106]|uniref:hypothetical protein n=1 Tax=Novosphingobium sp. G106 TaxID=2849500 RepID=UPI001C2DD61E|nr:hypothetical protein [Novosphingobium sp. G106]MBV1688252.1 hypothetical protein [Novosphingobium sp. G106]